MPPSAVIAYGGGIQSTAMLVLAAERRIMADALLFANVGEDSEDPATLQFVREHALPYATRHGLDLHILTRRKRDGSVETLWGRMMREGSKSLPIPVRLSETGPPLSRACTADFKVSVREKWLRARGASKHDKVEVLVGISMDERVRAVDRKPRPHEMLRYPLLELGLARWDCQRIIIAAGLPLPPKSSCFFCPFHCYNTWSKQKRDRPDLFAKSVLLEQTLTARRVAVGKDPVYLTRYGKPLVDVVEDPAAELFDASEGACPSGHCFT
jgi:hypothetical protein